MLFLDTETRSATPINRGLYRYMGDEHFNVIIVTYAEDDGDVQIWEPLKNPDMPVDLRRALKRTAKGDVWKTGLTCHNSMFDRRALRFGNIATVEASRIIDTMVMALSCGLPANLDDLGAALGLDADHAKIKEGRSLIRMFCTPNKTGPLFFDETTHPEEYERFREYAKQDIVAMREVFKRLPKMNLRMEHPYWVVDQAIQDRGIPVDVGLAEAAHTVYLAERKRLGRRISRLTRGAIGSATQNKALLEYINTTYKLKIPNLQADTLVSLLRSESTPEDVKALVRVRQQASLTSAAKYKTILNMQVDGRMHDTLQFMGASRTGRDSGRSLQPQNLMRANLWWGLEGKELDAAIEDDVQVVKLGMAQLLDDNPMNLIGNLVRSVIQAPEGYKIVQSDLSSIESRAAMWLADDTETLQFYRDFDAGLLKYDQYMLTYARTMNEAPEEVTSDKRQIGKPILLGLQYGGGAAAFNNYAAIYDLNMHQLAEEVWASGNVTHLNECLDKHEWAQANGFSGGMKPRIYAACEYIKQRWRNANPVTSQYWQSLEAGFRQAVAHEGKTFSSGPHLRWRRQGKWTFLRLPSGRVLCFPLAKVSRDGTMTFMGRDGFTKKYQEIETYYGKLAENCASGVARDILIHRLPDVEAAGYKIITRVHDELVTLAPDTDEYGPEQLSKIITKPYDWTEGLPLAADGFGSYRYKKE